MKKKPTKYDYKRVLPTELYVDEKKGKRGQGELKKSVNTRLSIEEYKDLMELLSTIKVKRSNFVRYAINKLSIEVGDIVEKQKKELIDEQEK